MELDKVISDYIAETGIPMTIEEVKGSVQFAQPLYNKYGYIGFFGYDVAESAILGEVAVVKLAYVLPEHRRTFKPVMQSIFNYLDKQGYETVELHTTKKINNWVRKHLGTIPVTFVHRAKTKEYLRKLGRNKYES